MKYIILTLIISTSLFSVQNNELVNVDWQENYKTALNKAKNTNKLLLVFITSKDCKFCEKLKNTTLKEPEIVNKINQKYSSVIVMKDRDPFPKKLNAKATPILYFLDKNEKIIDYSVGYWDKVDFKYILKDVEKRLAKRKDK
jgi:thioredoxin-related protein